MFLPLFCQSISADSLDFVVEYRELPNLIYQLDNISGMLPWESSGNFKKLWQDNFLTDTSEEAWIQRWKAQRLKQVRVEPERSHIRLPISPVYRTGGSEYLVRSAGFRVDTVSQYRQLLSLELPKEFAEELGSVVAHFQPKFHEWWKSKGEAAGRGFITSLSETLNDPRVRNRVAQMQKFYEAELPKGTKIPFILLYRPSFILEPTSGQQLSKYSLVQFLEGEKPETRVDVVIHELCHFFFQSAKDESHLALQKNFLDLGDPGAVPAFQLLNEAVATALGNGVIGEIFDTPAHFASKLKRPRSLYNAPEIDRAAKSIYPWAKEALDSGLKISSKEFVQHYQRSVKEAFGDELLRPAAYLSDVSLYAHPDLGRASFSKLRQFMRVASYSAYETDFKSADSLGDFAEAKSKSFLFLVPPSAVDELVKRQVLTSARAEEIRLASVGGKPVGLGIRRGPNGIVFVLVATKVDDLDGLLKRIPKFEKLPVGIFTPDP